MANTIVRTQCWCQRPKGLVCYVGGNLGGGWEDLSETVFVSQPALSDLVLHAVHVEEAACIPSLVSWSYFKFMWLLNMLIS